MKSAVAEGVVNQQKSRDQAEDMAACRKRGWAGLVQGRAGTPNLPAAARQLLHLAASEALPAHPSP